MAYQRLSINDFRFKQTGYGRYEVTYTSPKTMKTIFITLAFIVLLSGCATTKKCTCTSAWITYCNKYNINPHKATLEQENYFLDCYYGSTEYENDINNYNY